MARNLFALAFAPVVLSAFPIGQTVTVRYETTAPGIFGNGFVDVTGYPGTKPNPQTARSGVFSLEYQEGVNWVDFKAVCIDANETLFSGTKLYFAQTLPTLNQNILPLGTMAPPVFTTPADNARILNLRKLFTVGWTDATSSVNSVKSAAFQWAVWNVVRDTNLTVSSNPATGVRITGTSAPQQQVITQANTYLSQMAALAANTPLMKLSVWTPIKAVTTTSGVTYERVPGQELLMPNPVPEPGVMIELMLGCLALVAVRRFRMAPAGA